MKFLWMMNFFFGWLGLNSIWMYIVDRYLLHIWTQTFGKLQTIEGSIGIPFRAKLSHFSLLFRVHQSISLNWHWWMPYTCTQQNEIGITLGISTTIFQLGPSFPFRLMLSLFLISWLFYLVYDLSISNFQMFSIRLQNMLVCVCLYKFVNINNHMGQLVDYDINSWSRSSWTFLTIILVWKNKPLTDAANTDGARDCIVYSIKMELCTASHVFDFILVDHITRWEFTFNDSSISLWLQIYA